MSRSVVVLGLVVAVMAGVMVVRGGRELRPDASAEIEREHALQGRPGARLAADAVLAISPRVAAVRPDSAAPIPKLSPAMQEYASAKAYKPIYERLKAAGSRSPEETWILAKIVDDCAAVTGRDASGTRRPAGEEAMARFAATLSPKDPLRDRRIAAFGAMNGDRCGGLRDVKATEKDIRDLLAEAAAVGDPKAAADLVFKDVLARFKDANGKFSFATPVMISDAEIETLKRSMESGDPEALTGAVRAFMLPIANLSLRVGPDEQPVDMAAWFGAAHLMACDLGADCGPDSRELLNGCALQGHCDATSLREYMYYYGMSPAASQQIAQYQAYLAQAVRNRDWSAITFFRGPRPNLATFIGR
ncbi:MAG TPA: hypothetical protein VFO24_13805 [Usitatibacter sp.]|nr:hypothetical protein [Usitatibacter sp.]